MAGEGEKMKKDKFTQLVDDMVSGEIGFNLLQMAIRQYVRKSKEIPEEIKDLLAGRSEASAGLIYKMFTPISEMIGTVELAYRRGVQGNIRRGVGLMKEGEKT